jgi:anti-anti-sigma factor
MIPAVRTALPIWRTSRYTVVGLPAQIDVANADELRERLVAVLNDGGTTELPFVVDVTGTRFCDSSGVNALLRVHTHAMALGRRMYMAVRPDGLVRKVFDITAVPRLIPTCDDLGSAIAMAVVTALDDSGEPDPPDDDAPYRNEKTMGFDHADKNGPRQDDAQESEEGRPSTDQSSEEGTAGGTAVGMNQRDVAERAELATSLQPSVFPATAERLVASATETQAPGHILRLLKSLPPQETYQNLQDLWRALGGGTEDIDHRA